MRDDGQKRDGGTRVLLLGLAVLGLVLAFVSPAAAHVPMLEPDRSSDAPPQPGEPFPGAIEAPDPHVSRAVYGTLAPGEAFDVYRFTTETETTIPIGILIPLEDSLEDFRPPFALIGSGVTDEGDPPAFLEDHIAAASEEAGGEVGVRVVRWSAEEPSTFFEPFSFERYWEGPEISVPLTPGVAYYLVVWPEPEVDEASPYVFGLGTREAFSAEDIVGSVAAVAQLKLGLYGQEGFNWSGVFLLVVLLAALAGLIYVVVELIRRARSEA